MHEVKKFIRKKYFSLNKYLLNTYYIPNTILDTEIEEEQNQQKSCPHRGHIILNKYGCTIKKKVHIIFLSFKCSSSKYFKKLIVGE